MEGMIGLKGHFPCYLHHTSLWMDSHNFDPFDIYMQYNITYQPRSQALAQFPSFPGFSLGTRIITTTCLALWPCNSSLHHKHVAITLHKLWKGEARSHTCCHFSVYHFGLLQVFPSIHMTQVLMPVWAQVYLKTNLFHWKLHATCYFGGFSDLKRLCM